MAEAHQEGTSGSDLENVATHCHRVSSEARSSNVGCLTIRLSDGEEELDRKRACEAEDACHCFL